MNPLTSRYHDWRFQRLQKAHRLSQGRLTTAEAASQLAAEGHIPLASVPDSLEENAISIPPDVDGHLLLVAPPDSAWRAHLITTLVRWPSAALVIDPDGYLYQKTGYFRDVMYGKVFAIPGYRFNLSEYYRSWDGDAAAKLHRFLMRPGPDAETWRQDHSVALFHALGLYSFHHRQNLMQDVLDAATTDLYRVLETLATVPDAWQQACRFTKGLSPREALSDTDVVRSFSLFARQMQPYQKTYAAYAIEPAEDVVPKTWTTNKNTLYLTYPLTQLPELAGLAAALVDGMRHYHHTHGRYRKLLLVLDAEFAQHLPRIEQVLTEATAYGITVILTAVSLQALHDLASDGDGAALAGRFAHQVWYPPHDRQTAEHMAWLYGTQLQRNSLSNASVETHDDPPMEPALAVEALLAWPQEQVLVYTRQERPYRFLAEQVVVPAKLPVRAAPVPPQEVPAPRDYLAWLPLELVQKSNPEHPSDASKIADDNLVHTENEPAKAETEDSDLTIPTPSAKPDEKEGVQTPLPLQTLEDGRQTAAPDESDIAPPSTSKTRLR